MNKDIKDITGFTGINVFELIPDDITELDHIIGQEVIVKSKGKSHKGILQFVGTNPVFPKLGLHCTVSRVPLITIDSINDIELIDYSAQSIC